MTSKYLSTSAPSSLIASSLFSNLLSGKLPSWIFALPYLKILWPDDNHFTGELVAFQSTSLKSVYLSENKLHGLIPRSIFLNRNLRFLCLTSNNFTGDIPTSFCNMTFLLMLDLSYNNLSGNIASCFGNFNNNL